MVREWAAWFALGPDGGQECSADSCFANSISDAGTIAPIAGIAATALLIAPIAAARPTVRRVPVTSQVGGCVGWVSREAHRVLG